MTIRSIRSRTHTGAGLGLALLMLAAPLGAQVVYSGGAPAGSNSNDIFDDFRAADNFALAGPATFNSIRFWALLPTGSVYTPSIYWELLHDDGGLPGASVASGLVTAMMTFRTALAFGFDSWQADLSVAETSLGAGVFWLALHDGALGDATGSTMFWETSDSGYGADYAVDFIPSGEWTGEWEGNLAFELSHTVPEPPSVTLVLIGLVGVAAVRRRGKPRA